MEANELTHAIIGAAIEVHQRLEDGVDALLQRNDIHIATCKCGVPDKVAELFNTSGG